ncbi:IS1634 family transposase [Thomasclavelia cocleata]|uniref:IS1634 family transposase n=1 Tax=Thomasclavelia cocleata TaxID=69824 RepID=UPI003C7038AA
MIQGKQGKLSKNNSILYYDCTNFYFEIEDGEDMCKYGKSKENRPNPIVQYGLFADTDGIPIVGIVFDGNRNEQFSMRELEEEIAKDFQLSRFIVCADAGLNGFDNKVYNDMKHNGAYIIIQPIRKLKKTLKTWVLYTRRWKLLNHPGEYDISTLDDITNIDGQTYKTKDLVFYKDR